MTDYKKIGKGIVEADKVRVYHHFWGDYSPPKSNWTGMMMMRCPSCAI